MDLFSYGPEFMEFILKMWKKIEASSAKHKNDSMEYNAVK